MTTTGIPPKYDTSTYSGRFAQFLDVVDPRSLFYTEAQLREALELLNHPERAASKERLWEAQKIKESVINPGTNEPVPLPLRMSAFVPMNVPIIFGMLAATTTRATVFWQVVNQTYNSAVNYANRSGATVSTQEIARSYLLAVGSAVGISLSFSRLAHAGPLPLRRVLTRVPFLVPYLAVAGAGAANVYASRYPEISQGVPVTDAEGNYLGTSKEAGRQGVWKTILTRSMGLPLPVLVLPPLVTEVVVPAATTSPRVRMMGELAVITMCLVGALPAAIAVFPQRLELKVDSLEPDFHNLIDPKTNRRITVVFANKGM